VCRDIERRRSHDEHTHLPWLSQQDNYYHVLLLCVIVILIICVLYVRSTWQTAAALRRVPTMSYYMLDADSGPSSVHVQKSRSYSQLLGSIYTS